MASGPRDVYTPSHASHMKLKRLQPATGGKPAGQHRLAIFAAAGLIEVTPESVREWNREVLAGHRRFLAGDVNTRRPRWGDLMSKLLSFHVQGGRVSHSDIAAALPPLRGGKPVSRVLLNQALLSMRYASEAVRLAVARYAGLDPEQIAYIEEGITSGIISVGFNHRTTPLTAALTGILAKLESQGVNMRQLAAQCATQRVPGAVPVHPPDLSSWRYGRFTNRCRKR